MAIKDLERSSVVRALKDLDPEGAKVEEGDVGIVFEETNFYGDGCGPMVRWIKTLVGGIVSGGVCNVYEGDVEVVHGSLKEVG